MPDNNNEEIIADFNIETTNIEGNCEVNTGDKFEFNIDINATPEKTSQLINDGDGESPFVTENELQAQLPEKTSQLINDGDGESPFVTENELQAQLPEKTSQLINDGDGTKPFITEDNIQTPESSVIVLNKENNVITIKSTMYVFVQGIASRAWEIEHNLGKRPSITIVDSANEVQEPDDITYNSNNKVTVYFLSEFAGKAYIN